MQINELCNSQGCIDHKDLVSAIFQRKQDKIIALMFFSVARVTQIAQIALTILFQFSAAKPAREIQMSICQFFLVSTLVSEH